MRLDAALIREALAHPGELPELGFAVDARGARAAAVVVPLRFDPEPVALMVLRASHLKDHAGEVGFPGGKPEPTDADLAATALREMEEEIGVRPVEVELLGTLRPVPVITGRFLIHSFVGALLPGAAPRVASTEIDRLLELPLLPLLSGEHRFSAIHGEFEGVRLYAPHFELDGCTLYGASAYLFHELLERIARRTGQPLPLADMTTEPPWGDRYTRPT